MVKSDDPEPKHKDEPKPRKGRRGPIIIAIVVIALLALGVYVYFAYAWLPIALLFAKSYSLSSLATILVNRVDSFSMLNINYSGSMTISNGSDPAIGLTFAKYYNSSAASLYINGLPVFGNLSTRFSGNFTALLEAYLPNLITPAPGSFNASSSSVCINIYNTTAEANNYSCSRLSELMPNGPVATDLNKLVNASSYSNLKLGSYGLAFQGIQPCYSFSGSGSVMINGALVGQPGYVPSNFNFSACLSAQYGVPYSIDVAIHAGGKLVQVNLTQVTLSLSTTPEQVSALYKS